MWVLGVPRRGRYPTHSVKLFVAHLGRTRWFEQLPVTCGFHMLIFSNCGITSIASPSRC